MPRDKTATHQRLVTCIRQEFLENGYERASLKNIASNAGITAAGIYRHFPSKEAMFTAMVEPVTGDFLRLCSASMEETYAKFSEKDFLDRFNDYRDGKNREFVSFMYDHYDVFRLLLVCSGGTPYENFESKLIEIEQQSVLDLFDFMDRKKIPHHQVTKDELHLLCTMLVSAVCEVIRHEYTREQALKHMDFVGRLLYPGIRQVLGF